MELHQGKLLKQQITLQLRKKNLSKAELTGLLIASAVLITLSMLFSISESAFLSMNKLRLRVLRKKGVKSAERAGRLLEKKEILINTLLVANDLANILLSSIITAVCLELFGAKGVGYATFLVTLFLLVFGEITPKTISTRNPDGIAYALSFFVTAVVFILRPVVALFTFVSRVVLKIRGIDTRKKRQSYTEEDIKSFIEAGGETGVLENGEKHMMNRVFKFNDLEAQDIMTPRTSIIALKEDASYFQVLELAQRNRLSYFPVYRENLDDITGMLYLKDLMTLADENGNINTETFSVTKIMRKPLFVPGTNKMSSVQELLRTSHQSAAIVIDEYAGTDGILTKEDISLEIIGSGINTKPWRTSVNLTELKGQEEFEIDGTTLLADLKEIIGFELRSKINETLGGWITEQLGRLALPYDSIAANGYVFTVTDVSQRRVKSVFIRKVEAQSGEEDEQ